MTVTVSTLIEEVRSLLRDYGNAITTMAAALSTTDGTSVSLTSVADLNPGSFILVGDELMEVREIFPGTPGTVTATRGSRGSTAATHASGDVVRVAPIYGSHEILRALNQAMDNAFPQVYLLGDDSTTEDTVAEQWEYDIPTTIDNLVRVEIGNSANDSFTISRCWSMQGDDSIYLDDGDSLAAGLDIRFIGYSHFTALTAAGSTHASFPTDRVTLRYLTLRAAVDLEIDRQVVIGRRDAFVGITDSFQQSMPLMTASTAKMLGAECDRLLKKATMPRIKEYMPEAGRHYYRR